MHFTLNKKNVKDIQRKAKIYFSKKELRNTSAKCEYNNIFCFNKEQLVMPRIKRNKFLQSLCNKINYFKRTKLRGFRGLE